MSPFQILDDQQTTLRLPPGAVDPAGNPLGNWDAPPTWAVDAPDVVAITPAADGLSCLATTTGKLGPANVSYTGTAGGAALTNTFAFTVAADTGQPVAPPIAADPPVSRLQPAAGGQPAAAST